MSEDATIPDGSRTRLNVVLWLLVVLTAVAVIFLGVKMWDTHADDGGSVLSRIGHVLADKHPDTSIAAGTDVGSGTVEAMPQSKGVDQERIADVLTAGTKFVDAFMNIDYKTIDSSIRTIRSLGTGGFRKQYDKSTKGLKTLTARVKSVSRAEVVWAAYETGDADSATLLLTTSGTVSSTVTKGQPTARYDRIRLDMSKVGDQWLANNIVFVGAS